MDELLSWGVKLADIEVMARWFSLVPAKRTDARRLESPDDL